jgi:L-seryl-tRNA(Ser) seleniumtransferase
MANPIPSEAGAILRQIPSVDKLLATPGVQDLLVRHPRWAVLEAIRETLASHRSRTQAGAVTAEAAHRLLEPTALLAEVEAATRRKAGGSLRPVINATGVVIHTNLGRAPLAPSVLAAIDAAARGYSNLEFDLASGLRGSRQVHVEELLRALTGAEAALVVNNNAAALLLAVNTLANNREVIISRGELVEIGDAFRIPDVMTRAGGRLREVGTTNRTHLADYEQAIGPETALILKVHRSNFLLLGFTAEVEGADLATLARRNGLPLVEDLGSGALLDFSAFGLRREPQVGDAIRAGVDLVTFSGDKLLGGPQAGILVGRRDLIARIRRNPLARTVRIDKLCLAGLEATLRLARHPEKARQEIPVLRMLSETADAVGDRAEALAAALRSVVPDALCSVEDGASEVGGGALPLQALPSRVLVLRPGRERANVLEARLRTGEPPVLVRVQDDRLLLDLRTVALEEGPGLLAALRAALAEEQGGTRHDD